MVDFRRGAEAAKEASKGASFAKTHYFSLEDGAQTLLRFLTEADSWIVVDQHNNIPTKAAPADWPKESRWPDRMGAVCRKDQAFAGMYPDCFICDHVVGTNGVKRPSARSWAYAVLREEVREDGKIVGYRDQTREVAQTDKDGKATGETITEKAIVVVNMGFKNFFSALDGFAKHYGTVLDRDYLVKRSGTGTDTAYSIIPLDPIVVDAEGTKFDLRLPQFAERYKPAEDLGAVVTERSSDEFFARFFDTRVAAPPLKTGDSAQSTSTSAPAPAADAPRAGNDVDADKMKALAARVKGMPDAPAAQEAPAETPAHPDAPATAVPPQESPASAPGVMRDFS